MLNFSPSMGKFLAILLTDAHYFKWASFILFLQTSYTNISLHLLDLMFFERRLSRKEEKSRVW
jgi:hypothetical protein